MSFGARQATIAAPIAHTNFFCTGYRALARGAYVTILVCFPSAVFRYGASDYFNDILRGDPSCVYGACVVLTAREGDEDLMNLLLQQQAYFETGILCS